MLEDAVGKQAGLLLALVAHLIVGNRHGAVGLTSDEGRDVDEVTDKIEIISIGLALLECLIEALEVGGLGIESADLAIQDDSDRGGGNTGNKAGLMCHVGSPIGLMPVYVRPRWRCQQQQAAC